MTERQVAIVLMLVTSVLHLMLAWISPAGTAATATGVFGLLYLGVAAALAFTGSPGIWFGRTIPAIGALVALGGIVTGQQPAFPWMVPLVILDIVVLWLCWSRMTAAPA